LKNYLDSFVQNVNIYKQRDNGEYDFYSKSN